MKQSLEERIRDCLLSGPRKRVDLVDEIATTSRTSVQGVYKSLRKLKKEEIVTIHNHTVSLSLVWISREQNKLTFAENAYRLSPLLEALHTDTRQKIVCSFNTLTEIDLFWTHAYTVLTHDLSNDKCSYVVQPHDWYYYVRHETDRFWAQEHKKIGRVQRSLITHATALDQLVIRTRKKELGRLLEYTFNQNPLHQSETTYYNIVGGYIVTAQFDLKVASRLNDFVRSNTCLPLELDAQREIKNIITGRGRFRLTIEKNEKKAKSMIDKVKKYFEF